MKKKNKLGLILCGLLTILFPLRLYFDLIGTALISLIPLHVLPGYLLKYYLWRPAVMVLQVFCIIVAVGLLKAKSWAANCCVAMNWFVVFLAVVSLFLPNLPISLAGKIELISVGIFLIWYLKK